jgi:mono/diheme cytochrome c family protein
MNGRRMVFVASGFSRKILPPEGGSHILLSLACCALAIVSSDARAAARQAAQPATPQASSQQSVLNQYCITCHNSRAKTAGLALDALNLEQVGRDAETWEKVVRKVRTGMMPPSGARRPERQVLDGLASDLETRLDRAGVVDAGLEGPALHRLNRTEYANAIRDLLDLEIDATTLLPADASSEGFDNIADALGVSPSLIQGYVSAAMKISRRAVGDRTLTPSQITYAAPAALSQDRHIEGLPLGTRGGMLVRHSFPLDAEYEFNVTGGFGGGGLGGANFDVTLDGAKLAVQNPRNFRIKVSAGPHVVGVALVDRVRSAGVDEAYSDFRIDSAFTAPGSVQSIVITGPYNATGLGETPSRRRIFVCRPEGRPSSPRGDEGFCARKIVTNLARHAYRRPVLDDEVETLMGFYQQGHKDGDFESGIQQALARILVAPAFLYRVEEEPRSAQPGKPYRLGDLELASRLSFFLWSSIPDDELLDVASKGRLRDPIVRAQQVKRMLADPKAEALTSNFAGQWLFLRELSTVQTSAREFDDNLRQAFRTETEMLFSRIVREDRSIVDLLRADYTFVDERLARHYGIPNVHGSYVRRVAIEPSDPRRGLLGHGSMLTVTSVATRTSPVSRGKWILENLLGTPAPVPPPGVETNLEKDSVQVKTTSVRQRLEAHRANPVCASCHKIMDPIGLSLENFDQIGAWRERDAGVPIDSTGQLVDGTPLRGPADLREALLSRSDAFVTAATERLFTYALGRPVRYTDMPTVRAIVRRAAPDDYRMSSLVLGVVESAPFRMRVKASGPGPQGSGLSRP